MKRHGSITALLAVGMALAAACAGDDADSGPSQTPSTSTTATIADRTPDSSTTSPQEQQTTSSAPPATAEQATTTTALDDEQWRARVDEFCAHYLTVFAIPEPGGDPASLQTFVASHQDIHDRAPDVGTLGVPPGPGREPADLLAARTGLDEALALAADAAVAGDLDGTWDGIDELNAHLGYFASAFAAAGQGCGPADPHRAAAANLNVSIVAPWQVEVGFGSVWVSQFWSNTVVRLDPADGQVLATIEVPSRPFKLQAADGAMVLRTADSYEVIDAASNTIIASRSKADVGPEANRSWATDGALWICDGQRLHRYDPITLTPEVALELDVDCGQVYATPELVVAWSYNEDPGESGASRAAFIDPATNTPQATVDLTADAGVPVVLDNVVFFPPQLGTSASVVDRSTWSITAAPDLGRFIDGGSQPGYDGSAIFVIADKAAGSVAVVNPTTFEVTDELLAMNTAPSVNALAASPGAIWVANNSGGVVQRFDTAN